MQRHWELCSNSIPSQSMKKNLSTLSLSYNAYQSAKQKNSKVTFLKTRGRLNYDSTFQWENRVQQSHGLSSRQVTWCRNSTASGSRRIPVTSWSSTGYAPSSTAGSCECWRTQTWLCAPTSLPLTSAWSISKPTTTTTTSTPTKPFTSPLRSPWGVW